MPAPAFPCRIARNRGPSSRPTAQCRPQRPIAAFSRVWTAKGAPPPERRGASHSGSASRSTKPSSGTSAPGAGGPLGSEQWGAGSRRRGGRGRRFAGGGACVVGGAGIVRRTRVGRPVAVSPRPARRRRSLRASVALAALRAWGPGRSRGSSWARGACRAVGPLRSRGSRRTNRTGRTGGAGLAVLAILAGGSGRPRTARRPRWPLGSDDALPRLTAASRRARHGSMPKALHLPCEGVSRLVRRGQVMRECDDLNSEPRQERHHEEDRHGGQDFRPREPRPRAQRAHFATTAQIAIAAARRPINTGMIIW
ncbi:hypothetical protein SAMN05216268_106107 [Streptomyces yunnanensis]|uniref:Uncharacterized protein n=1 Tax=Streptomyces yunnanensis TaxID=156453 RepID=A0A9X8MTG5_9ACTN|nr:hypothetical protein SAMN05216268_106107 [Streptomyces yunnanensis]